MRKIEPYGDYAQVLVLAVPPLEEVGPPEVSAEFARIANDEMAELVQRFGDRFAGFAAALPLSDVELALRELDRTLAQLGALGAQLYTNVLGTALDEPRFEPLLTRLQDAGRAVWLHPTRSAAWADYPAESRSDFGLWWSLGLPLRNRRRPCTPRLFRAHGASPAPARDRAPRWRHGAALLRPLVMGPGYRQVKDRLNLLLLDYFRRFHVDTALFGAPHAVRCVLEFFGRRHVLFGTDMPLGPSNSVEATIADIDSAGLSREDMAAVYSGNVLVRLLGLHSG